MPLPERTTTALGILSLSVLPFLSLAAPAQAVPESSQRLIVTFEPGVAADSAAVERAGAEPLTHLDLVNGLAVDAPNRAVAARLAQLDGVAGVSVDARVRVAAPQRCSPWPACKDGTTTEPAQILPWGVDRVDAEKAWSASRGTGVNVAVIDTGIDRAHADLIDNIAGGVNFVKGPGPSWKAPDSTAWNDDQGHGTHVAGTIAAANNTIGVVGVAPEADLYGVKVLDSSGNGYASDVVLGIEWSIANGMQVINLSLAEDSDVPALKEAVDKAAATGIVVVAAAANSGDGNPSTNNVLWPAKYESAIAVSATDSNDVVASFSSDGAEVEIAAPGVNVLSTTRGGGYGTMSGTSMATPHVAGVVAQMLAAPVVPGADTDGNGLWSSTEVRSHLQVTTDDLGDPGRDVFYGFGLADAQEAVTGTSSTP